MTSAKMMRHSVPRRALSSSSSESNSSSAKTVPIHKTPRGLAAAKMKPMREHPSTGVFAGSSTSTTTIVLPSSNNSSSNDVNNSNQHEATHFIKGGTPCDPAPPPFKLSEYGEESLYTLVLLRHGESEWNSQNRYTGWCDVELTKKGEQEARAAGRLLYENGIELDHAFTSVLKRASFSTNMCLNTAKQHWVPVTKTWRLNERHYGALQGYNKDTAYLDLNIDQELVMQMRRSYDTPPPRMENDHPYWHGNDRRYQSLSEEQLEKSRAESLKHTAERILPFFNSVIVPSMLQGNKCLIVSHANTLRTLIKHLDGISDEDIKGMSIPTGIPLLYRLDKNLKPVDPNYELEFQYMVEPKGYTWGTSRKHGFHGVYLGDLERLQDIQKKRDVTNRDWQRIILRNLAKGLLEDGSSHPNPVFETRQLWFQVHTKMSESEYNNMLLLVRMKDHLEQLLLERKQRFLTMAAYESIVNKLHLDAEGHVVEPFMALDDEKDRDERQRVWYESIALDLEEECLIK